MSISQTTKQGKKNANSKKSQTISTAAIPPVRQTNPLSPPKSSLPDVAVGDTIPPTRGQCVRGVRVVEQTVMASVAEFVSEVIPQSAATHVSAPNEPICWVRIQQWSADSKVSSLALIIGLARGYQIWTMQDKGEFEEVVSERKGPLKLGHLLPFRVDPLSDDRFRERRPLFALVEQLDSKCRCISFLSLRSGKVVHALNFNDSVKDMESSTKLFMVMLVDRAIIHEQTSLAEIYSVASPDRCIPPCVALSDSFLASTEDSLNTSLQSCGGVVCEKDELVCGQLITAAKSISKTIGDSLAASFVSNQNKASNNKTPINAGIVTIIDILSLPPHDAGPSSKQARPPPSVTAHFVAHADSRVGYMAFGNGGGRLLLTGSKDSTTFHLFAIHPHPLTARLSSVHHIYTLVRGTFSSARVIHCAFAADSRWLSISTNHGTTHLFPITPYGGPISARTHCGKFVNRESRFEKTTGAVSPHPVEQLTPSAKAANSIGSEIVLFKSHPSTSINAGLSKASLNPRQTCHYQTPTVVNPIERVKQGAFSPENLSAWVGDNAPNILSASGNNTCHHQHQYQYRNGVNGWVLDPNHRLATAFGSYHLIASPAATNHAEQGRSLSLFAMNTEGVLTEYRVVTSPATARERNSSSGSAASEPLLSSSPITYNIHSHMSGTGGKTSSVPDAPIKASVIPLLQWTLARNRGSSVEIVDPPLSPTNPLIEACSASGDDGRACGKGRKSSTPTWLPNVEANTYSGPYRRLWMGPQFTFGVYTSTEHSSAQLFNPSDTASSSSAFSSIGQRCCPVMIEKSAQLGVPSRDTASLEAASKVICGSWSSDYDFKPALADVDGSAYTAVREKIADAMKDDKKAKIESTIKAANGVANKEDLVQMKSAKHKM